MKGTEASPIGTLLGFTGVVIAACFLIGIFYIVRVRHLACRYWKKRKIVKHCESARYGEAVTVAESVKCEPWQMQDYVKDPEKLSETVGLALADALGKVGRAKDAEHVRLVAGGFTNQQAKTAAQTKAARTRQNDQ